MSSPPAGRRRAMEPSTHEPASMQQVTQFLLAHNYHLTALELVLEACAAGREEQVDDLTAFFSNRERFPLEELARRQVADVTDGGERLALAEYELRCCREELAEARRQLAAARSRQALGAAQGREPATAADTVGACAEAAAGAQLQSAQQASARAQGASAVDEELAAVRASLSDMQAQCASYAALVAKYEQQLALGPPALVESSPASQADATAIVAERQQGGRQPPDSSPCPPSSSSSSSSPGGPPQQQPEPTTSHHRLDALTTSLYDLLPALLPHLTVRGKVELLPLLAELARLDKGGQGSAMVGSIFGMISAPDMEQRNKIVAVCMDLAGSLEPAWNASVLLPLACNSLSSPGCSPERRALGAQLVAELLAAGLLQTEGQGLALVDELMAMASRLLQDRLAAVREAGLGLMASLLRRAPYRAMLAGDLAELLLQLLEDAAAPVAQAAEVQLLPALLAWAPPPADAHLLSELMLKAMVAATGHLASAAASAGDIPGSSCTSSSSSLREASERMAALGGVQTLLPLPHTGSATAAGMIDTAAYSAVERSAAVLARILAGPWLAMAIRDCPSWVVVERAHPAGSQGLFQAWAAQGAHTCSSHPPWQLANTLVLRLLPQLLDLLRALPTNGEEAECARQGCAALLQNVCDSLFGQGAVRMVLVPLLCCAAALAHYRVDAASGMLQSVEVLPQLTWQQGGPPALQDFARKALPLTPEEATRARSSLLPYLFSVVLPCSGLLPTFLQALAEPSDGDDAGSQQASWLLRYRRDAVAALQFTARYRAGKAALPAALEALLSRAAMAGSGASMQQQLGTVLALEALLPAAGEELVRTRLIPGLTTLLLSTEEDAVAAAVVAALGSLLEDTFAQAPLRSLEQQLGLLDAALPLPEPGSSAAPCRSLTLLALLSVCTRLSAKAVPLAPSSATAAALSEWLLSKLSRVVSVELVDGGRLRPDNTSSSSLRQMATLVLQALSCAYATSPLPPQLAAALQACLDALLLCKSLLDASHAEQLAAMAAGSAPHDGSLVVGAINGTSDTAASSIAVVPHAPRSEAMLQQVVASPVKPRTAAASASAPVSPLQLVPGQSQGGRFANFKSKIKAKFGKNKEAQLKSASLAPSAQATGPDNAALLSTAALLPRSTSAPDQATREQPTGPSPAGLTLNGGDTEQPPGHQQLVMSSPAAGEQQPVASGTLPQAANHHFQLLGDEDDL